MKRERQDKGGKKVKEEAEGEDRVEEEGDEGEEGEQEEGKKEGGRKRRKLTNK